MTWAVRGRSFRKHWTKRSHGPWIANPEPRAGVDGKIAPSCLAGLACKTWFLALGECLCMGALWPAQGMVRLSSGGLECGVVAHRSAAHLVGGELHCSRLSRERRAGIAGTALAGLANKQTVARTRRIAHFQRLCHERGRQRVGRRRHPHEIRGDTWHEGVRCGKSDDVQRAGADTCWSAGPCSASLRRR